MPETKGVEMMRRLNDGQIEVQLSHAVAQTRGSVTAAIEELIEVGARIRPLYVYGKRTGWVRGVHLSERKALRRWVTDEIGSLERLHRRLFKRRNCFSKVDSAERPYGLQGSRQKFSAKLTWIIWIATF